MYVYGFLILCISEHVLKLIFCSIILYICIYAQELFLKKWKDKKMAYIVLLHMTTYGLVYSHILYSSDNSNYQSIRKKSFLNVLCDRKSMRKNLKKKNTKITNIKC